VSGKTGHHPSFSTASSSSSSSTTGGGSSSSSSLAAQKRHVAAAHHSEAVNTAAVFQGWRAEAEKATQAKGTAAQAQPAASVKVEEDVNYQRALRGPPIPPPQSPPSPSSSSSPPSPSPSSPSSLRWDGFFGLSNAKVQGLIEGLPNAFEVVMAAAAAAADDDDDDDTDTKCSMVVDRWRDGDEGGGDGGYEFVGFSALSSKLLREAKQRHAYTVS
jgi:hypothetical protein